MAKITAKTRAKAKSLQSSANVQRFKDAKPSIDDLKGYFARATVNKVPDKKVAPPKAKPNLKGLAPNANGKKDFKVGSVGASNARSAEIMAKRAKLKKDGITGKGDRAFANTNVNKASKKTQFSGAKDKVVDESTRTYVDVSKRGNMSRKH